MLSKKRIVDDELLVQFFIAQILEPRGMPAFKRASSGKEELDMLLDIEMIDMDGYTVCLDKRAGEKYRFTMIIMVSDRTDMDEPLRGYEAGADDYIAKPFDKQEFLGR